MKCIIFASIFASIFLINTAYGIECSAGAGYRFPITCPGIFDSTKNRCCEIDGQFRCCDEVEFLSQKAISDDHDPHTALVFRHKRYSDYDTESTAAVAVGLGTTAIVGIIFAALFPFILCCCCCCCCACCPCYHWCHPNSTNVTVVNPGGGGGGGSTQNNFCVNVPSQSLPMGGQQPPPQYSQSDNQGGSWK